jgi:hypothetical protein
MPDFGHPSFLELRRSGGPVWWSILVRAGVVKSVPSGSRFGNKSIATDGHLCLSILEWKFCELLHLAGIPHIREPRYSAERGDRADFRIGALFVEIAGLTGMPEYDDRLALKIWRAFKMGQEVAVLTPKDVERIWKRGVIGLEDIDAFRVVNDPEKVEDS